MELPLRYKSKLSTHVWSVKATTICRRILKRSTLYLQNKAGGRGHGLLCHHSCFKEAGAGAGRQAAPPA